MVKGDEERNNTEGGKMIAGEQQEKELQGRKY